MLAVLEKNDKKNISEKELSGSEESYHKSPTDQKLNKVTELDEKLQEEE